jgi:hypothetical protein
MTTEAEEEQAERRRVLRNDQRVREQGSTYRDHTHIDDAGGRFAAVNAAEIVGGTPTPIYPALPASSPWAGPDLVGREPPLGFEIDALEPSSFPAQATGPTSEADSPSTVLPCSDEPLADDVGPSSPRSDER